MQTIAVHWAPTRYAEPRPFRAPELPDTDVEDAALADLSIEDVREAVRHHQVSFPSQIPVFTKHDRPDLQVKVVQLYFVRGWSCQKAGERYGLTRARVWQILTTWKRRAVQVGYIQVIPSAPPVQHAVPAIGALVYPGARRATISSVAILVRNHAGGEDRESTDPQRTYRPRSKAGVVQIVAVLKQLAAGKSAEEMASKAGVSTDTLRTWKEKYGVLADEADEVRRLRVENQRLQKLVADLSAGKDLLIHPIRKSYSLPA